MAPKQAEKMLQMKMAALCRRGPHTDKEQGLEMGGHGEPAVALALWVTALLLLL